jgi:uncharacterized membrane protein YhaH (DUF805 family)
MDPKAARRGLDGASVCCREGTSIGGAIMNISDLFLSFRGRISRGQYWIATGMVAVLALALQWMLGVPIMSDPSSLRLRTIAFVIGLISMYPTAAIAVKRLHDRDQPATYVWLLVVAFAVVLIGDLLGYFDDSIDLSFMSWIAIIFVAFVGLAFLVELGIRRGTPGPNEHGPDPLGPRV